MAIISDTEDVDFLTGTADPDTFVLGRDGVRDRIYDFKDGVDKIDLTAYSVGFDTVTIIWKKPGVFKVKIRDEKFLVNFAPQEEGEPPLSPSSLTADDFIFRDGAAAAPAQIQSDSDGKQKLVGTTMPDVFIFTSDGDRDIVKRFEDDKDKIDLSSYSILWEDLTFIDKGNGRVRIEIDDGLGGDVVVLKDSSGLLTSADLTISDFIL